MIVDKKETKANVSYDNHSAWLPSLASVLVDRDEIVTFCRAVSVLRQLKQITNLQIIGAAISALSFVLIVLFNFIHD